MEIHNLSGKTAIVTGAGRGIGRSVAISLANAGAKVVVNSFTLGNTTKVVEEIESRNGIAIACSGNVSILDDVKKIIIKSLDHFNNIDILVNNAGVGGDGTLIQDLSYEEWNKVIQVNLSSTFMFCKEVMPYMIKQRYGKIVNMSSIYGITGTAGSVPYSAAKAGIIGLSKALAKEVAQYNVNVNVIAPGLVDTDMSRKRGTSNNSVLWPRIGLPQDIANSVLYLVDDASEFITGQVLSPNGGGLI